MADKKVSDFTEATSVAAGDWFEIENVAGNSRKVKGANLKMGEILLATNTPTGTSTSFDVATLTTGYSFNHLLVRFFGRSDAASVAHRELRMTVNSDTGSNYDGSYSEGDGATNTVDFTDTGATSFWAGYVAGATAPSGNPAWAEIFIPEYSSTTFRKMFQIRSGLMRAASSVNVLNLNASTQWRDTSAITGITLTIGISGNFITGTTVRLYGVY